MPLETVSQFSINYEEFTKYEDYLIHDDEERQKKYVARATKIKNKQGER